MPQPRPSCGAASLGSPETARSVRGMDCKSFSRTDRGDRQSGTLDRVSGETEDDWALPGHHTARPIRAVRAGVKNIAMTNAATAMPTEMANPIWLRVDWPASVRDAKDPA